ncbi:MAG: hypothetical protein AAGI11_16170 [Pseudomonadota bacterium]
MNQSRSRQLLFVVGMHRSGTSALCAALSASGATFGQYLLEALPGVNEEGFWEDEDVVRVNEALINARGYAWYTALDWEAYSNEALASVSAGSTSDELLATIDEILQRGFGDGPLEAVKDPRFCLTLPVWLQGCERLGIDPHLCWISREPLEVAASLQRRDGLPLDYGLRLTSAYLAAAEQCMPEGVQSFSYNQLLADPEAIIARLAESGLPLCVTGSELRSSVRQDLRNELAEPSQAATERSDLDLLKLMAEAFIERGQLLTEIGEQHTTSLQTLLERDAQIEEFDQRLKTAGAHLEQALATLAERDAQILGFDKQLAELGQMHGDALKTLEERDEQIADFDRRLSEVGQMHSDALARIGELDEQVASIYEQLERVFETPVMGRVFRRMWIREQG